MNVQHPIHFAPHVAFRTPTTAPRPATLRFRGFSNNTTNNQQPRTNNHATGITSFNCHQLGHYASNCPQKQGPTPVRFNMEATPTRTSMPGAGRGAPQTPVAAAKTPQPFGRGCVNNVTVEEAQTASDVVLGKFLVNSAPASVLLILEIRIRLFLGVLLQSIS